MAFTARQGAWAAARSVPIGVDRRFEILDPPPTRSRSRRERKQRLQTFSAIVDHPPEPPEDIDQRAGDNERPRV